MVAQRDMTGLRPWQQSSIGDRRSVLGALALVLITAFFVLGLPWIEENTEASGVFDESGRYIVDDYTTMQLADGWSVESQSELFTTLTDGTYQMIVVLSSPADASPEEILSEIHDAYASDPANTVTPIVTFVTDSGGDGAAYRFVLATDPTGNGSTSYAVVQNGRSFQPLATGPADLDDPYYEEVDTMVRSVEISATPREGGS